MSLAAQLRPLGLGRLALRLWHRPYGQVRELIAAGGPWAARRTELGRRAMEAAAYTLPPPAEPPGTVPLELHLLTGRRFWYQTAFCLWTFARHSDRSLLPVIHDDGTLQAPHRAALTRLFPRTRFTSRAAALARLDELLPVANFPVLRERWLNYPNIRKLIDLHLGSTGWKLVLDSDLLFFRRPTVLLDWLDRPDRPLHAVDCAESYGYSRPLLEQLAGAPIPPLVNVGLCGLRSDALDWVELEAWCATLIAREKASYYLEQALVALLAARQACTVAPATDYVTLPSRDEAHACHAVMHHYVANSKRSYFQHCWRTALARAPR